MKKSLANYRRIKGGNKTVFDLSQAVSRGRGRCDLLQALGFFGRIRWSGATRERRSSSPSCIRYGDQQPQQGERYVFEEEALVYVASAAHLLFSYGRFFFAGSGPKGRELIFLAELVPGTSASQSPFGVGAWLTLLTGSGIRTTTRPIFETSARGWQQL
eukprot:g17895.t1